MPFATVKSSQWQKGIARPKDRLLWPESFWKKLCERAQADQWFFGHKDPRAISPDCLEMIFALNLRMYGKR